MDNQDWIVPTLTVLIGFGVWWGLRSARRRGWIDTSPNRVRRGTGHALLGLQEFIQPSVEHVIQAENAEQADREDREGGDPHRRIPPPFRPGS